LSGLAQRPRGYRFGGYTFDPSTGELACGDDRRFLQQQPAVILEALLKKPGELITRSELVGQLWPNGTYVDFERSLNKAVTKLRDALQDSSENPQFIETLPRRGYRFVAPVVPFESNLEISATSMAASPVTAVQTVDGVAPALPSAAKNRNPGLLLFLTGAVLFATFALMFWLRGKQYAPATKMHSPQLMKLTDNRRVEHVAISPDGKYVAFTRREQDGLGLWVRQVASTAKDVRILAPQPVDFEGITFSPDSANIYFVRDSTEAPGADCLFEIALLGGPAKLLLQNISAPISFSPDGQYFVFTRSNASSGAIEVRIAAADGTGDRLLATLSGVDAFRQFGPAWSPDGSTILVSALSLDRVTRWSLIAIPTKAGASREIYSQRYKIGRPLWLNSGNKLLLAMDDENNHGQLYILQYPSGPIRRITNDLSDYEDELIDISRDSGTVAIVAWDQTGDLWEAPAANPVQTRQLTSSGLVLLNLASRSDGKILSTSLDNRLWIMDSDGSNRALFTEFHPASAPFACGPYVFFLRTTIQGDTTGLMRVARDGTGAQQHLNTAVNSAACAPDQRSVVFDEQYDPQSIGTISIEGGPPVTSLGIPAPEIEWQMDVSPDGKFLAYFYSEMMHGIPVAYKIAIVPTHGVSPAQSVRLPRPISRFRWSPDGKGFDYLVDPFARQSNNLWHQSLTSGKPVRLTNFTSGRIFDFNWSADRKRLLFTRGDWNGDVVILRNINE
jgi:DNA-binding winged helix-turn-helix (wHTH) protein/Tol biopolymer transport system component